MPSSGGAPANPTMTDPPDPPAPLPQPSGEAARIGQQNEADLVARALAGDRAAFGTLVERYAATARRVARAVLGDPDDADDAAQRSEEHTSELQSQSNIVCRLLLEKKKLAIHLSQIASIHQPVA